MVVGMYQRVTFQAIPPSCSQAYDRKIKMKLWLSLRFDKKNYAGQPNKEHVHTKFGEFFFFKVRPRIQICGMQAIGKFWMLWLWAERAIGLSARILIVRTYVNGYATHHMVVMPLNKFLWHTA